MAPSETAAATASRATRALGAARIVQVADRFPIERRRQVDQGNAMKTSVIGTHAMLSVWSVEEVERRIGEVPGVASVTVNVAARSATVRYD